MPLLQHSSRALHLGLLVSMHLSCFAVVVTGAEPRDLALCAGLYMARMFGVTAGYHRYFSHRSFKTSRGFQLALALLAMSSGQRGVLWWAWHHRHHHRTSDTPEDFHSPKHRGLLWSHALWWMSAECRTPDLRKVRDLTRFPELRALERVYVLPTLLTAVACYAIGGWSGFVVGYCWSTVLLWHGVFTINSLAHVWGSRDHETSDDSRNNAVLALITLGEGWHNNHHRCPSSAQQGVGWRQPDLTWMGLQVLAALGLVWDLRRWPEGVQARRSGRAEEATAPELATAGEVA